ncbi:MAG: hypothetical protein JSU67_17895 [Gammaproteobacteria bacterium]|nr:MAG: hypothetical protein EP300_12830 [Gammaproteobacteria bacterium]UCH39968.1 MAG: hypothetical protein JSU67_17895 [Gammaproteobacteria bacterium]
MDSIIRAINMIGIEQLHHIVLGSRLLRPACDDYNDST